MKPGPSRLYTPARRGCCRRSRALTREGPPQERGQHTVGGGQERVLSRRGIGPGEGLQRIGRVERQPMNTPEARQRLSIFASCFMLGRPISIAAPVKRIASIQRVGTLSSVVLSTTKLLPQSRRGSYQGEAAYVAVFALGHQSTFFMWLLAARSMRRFTVPPVKAYLYKGVPAHGRQLRYLPAPEGHVLHLVAHREGRPLPRRARS